MEQFIEQILAFISQSAASKVVLLPVGFAFSAGMMATVNPCGFALLPAYIGLYLGSDADGGQEASSLNRLARALLISLVVTLGFVVLFGSVGVIAGLGARFLGTALPWAGFSIGVVMVAIGIWLLAGRKKLYSGLAARLSARINIGTTGGIRSYFLFGIAYGTASLSCTLPIFLIAIGSSLAGGLLVNGLAFALGMGAVLTVLTVGTALFKGVVGSYMRRALPYIEKTSAAVIVLAGAFVIFYWLTIGDLVSSL